MSVTDTRSIDAISVEKDSGACVLTIADHLEWGDDKHLLMLQEKLNSYLAFVESGEIAEHVQDAQEREIHVNVVMLHEPDDQALNFLRVAAETIKGAGFTLRWALVDE